MRYCHGFLPSGQGRKASHRPCPCATSAKPVGARQGRAVRRAARRRGRPGRVPLLRLRHLREVAQPAQQRSAQHELLTGRATDVPVPLDLTSPKFLGKLALVVPLLAALAAGCAASRLGAKWRPEQCAAIEALPDDLPAFVHPSRLDLWQVNCALAAGAADGVPRADPGRRALPRGSSRREPAAAASRLPLTAKGMSTSPSTMATYGTRRRDRRAHPCALRRRGRGRRAGERRVRRRVRRVRVCAR